MKSGLDLSRFQKLSEDHKSATFRHPDGHKITVAKHVLSAGMRGELSKLPLHLEGGTPEGPLQGQDESQEQNHSPAPDEAPKQPTTVINIGQPQAQAPMASMPAAGTPPDPRMMGVHQESQEPQFPEPQTAPPQEVQPQKLQAPNKPDPYGANAYASVSKEGLQNQVQGIQGEAQGQNAINQAQAAVMDPMIQAQQKQVADYQTHTNNLRSEYQNFMQDYQNQHIDPNHFLNSMGTGQKISTAIGLILGGMGSGLTHQSNAALDFLNKQISNDVEAQKDNMGKSQNLLSANHAQFGNERDAVDMTTAMQRGIVANQIQQAALKSGNSLLIEKARQQVGQLELQNNQLFSQMAARQTLQNNLQPQGQNKPSNINAAQQIRLNAMTGQMSEDDKKEAYKELTKKEESQAFLKQYKDSFEDLNGLIGKGVLSPADRDSAVNVLAGKLTKLAEGRFNLQEAAQQIDAILPRSVGRWGGEGNDTTQKKLQRGISLINGFTKTPTLDAYGINPSDQQVKEGPPVGIK